MFEIWINRSLNGNRRFSVFVLELASISILTGQVVSGWARICSSLGVPLENKRRKGTLGFLPLGLYLFERVYASYGTLNHYKG